MGLFKRNDDAPTGARSDAPTVTIDVTPPAADAEIAKLTLDRAVSPGGSVYFTDVADAAGWPLVERLFAVDGVHSVLAKENVLIVSKAAGRAWTDVLPAAEDAVTQFYADHPDADARVAERDVDEDDIRRRVKEVLDAEINPAVASHGGVIRLLDVQGTRVFLQLGGGCQGCGMASVTLREGVERAIRTKVPEVTEILDTTDHASGTNPYYK